MYFYSVHYTLFIRNRYTYFTVYQCCSLLIAKNALPENHNRVAFNETVKRECNSCNNHKNVYSSIQKNCFLSRRDDSYSLKKGRKQPGCKAYSALGL